MAYIEFKNVVKQFGKNTVLNEINLDINKRRARHAAGAFRLRKIHAPALSLRA